LLAGALVLCWRVPGWQSLYRDRDAWLAEASTADTVALLSQTPIYWQAWYEVGQRLCRQAGSASGAERERVQAAGWDALRAAVRCRPRDPRLHANLAVSLWTAGHWTEARQHRDAQIALLPSDHAIRRQWLRAEWQAGHTDESRRLAYRFAEEAGTDPAAHEVLLWLAERELAEGSVVRAREALLVAARQRAADPALLKALARCEARLGNPDQEAEWLRRLTLTGRADAAAWWRIAELARLRRDRSALHEALGRAVQLDPSRRRAADALWKAFVQAAAPSAPPELR
jgi:tetratricopeptide (TPR) repeat protein